MIKIISNEVTLPWRERRRHYSKACTLNVGSRSRQVDVNWVSAQIKRYMSQEPDVTLDEPGGNLAPNDCDATLRTQAMMSQVVSLRRSLRLIRLLKQGCAQAQKRHRRLSERRAPTRSKLDVMRGDPWRQYVWCTAPV